MISAIDLVQVGLLNWSFTTFIFWLFLNDSTTQFRKLALVYDESSYKTFPLMTKLSELCSKINFSDANFVLPYTDIGQTGSSSLYGPFFPSKT